MRNAYLFALFALLLICTYADPFTSMVCPSSVYDIGNFDVSAISNQTVDDHIYVFIVEKNGVNTTSYDTATAGGSDNKSTTTFTCTQAICRDSIIRIVAAARIGSNIYSNSSACAIVPMTERASESAILKAFSGGNEKLNELNTLYATEITPGKYTMTVGSPSGFTFEKFTVIISKDGILESTTNYTGTSATFNMDCSSCTPGTWKSVRVKPVWNGVYAGESGWPKHLVVPRPTGIVSAAPSICDPENLRSKWAPVMALGLMGMLAVIAIAYMIGTSMNIPQLNVWSKTELGHLFMAVIMFIVIIWLMDMQCNLKVGEFLKWGSISHPFLQDDDTMMNAALKGLEWSIKQTHLSVVYVRYVLGVENMRASYTDYKTDNPGLGASGFSLSPMAGEWSLLSSVSMMLNMNTGFMVSLLFQYFSLMLFSTESGLFLFLVPIGLLMRSVPLLRGFGGGLVSIGVAFYLFYPIMLTMIAITLPPLYAGMDASDLAGTDSIDVIEGREREIEGDSIFSYFMSMPDLPSGLQAEGIDPAGDKFHTLNPAPLFKLTALNFIRAMLIPSAGLIVIASFVRDLSVLFGEETDASRLAMLV